MPISSVTSHKATARRHDRPTRAHSDLSSLLDRTYAQLRADDISGMDPFVGDVARIRRTVGTVAWRTLVQTVILPHPISDILREEPIARRAFEKPRGYAGDAPMLDLIYGETTGETYTPVGAQLAVWIRNQPSARSVQERRAILAMHIDHTAQRCSRPRILSVACGHLREAQQSTAMRAGTVGELVALDQDGQSLALIAREQGDRSVTPVRASVRRLLAAPATFGSFDLIYSAGLYDYLPDDIACTLTHTLFDMLHPGGELVVGNFAPELRDIGYLEAIMDWWLIYRDESSVAGFASRIAPERIAGQSLCRDSGGNVVYVALRRA